MTAGSARREELAANLAGLRARIEDVCRRVGRDPNELTVIAVTKTFPASDAALLAELGVPDIGENRDAEARAKHSELTDRPIRWHFIGRVQTNKARSVARYASVVHSVDRQALVDALGRGADTAGRRLRCLVQVRFAGGPDEGTGRSGATPSEVRALADRIAAEPALDLGGVMTVAPLGVDPGRVFAELAELAARVRADHPEAGWISAGMSEDLDAAIESGATHLRVGRRLLGERPPVTVVSA